MKITEDSSSKPSYYTPVLSEGDIVQLKSGGPHLTVANSQVAADGKIWIFCQWFTQDGEIRDGRFSIAMLRPTHPIAGDSFAK